MARNTLSLHDSFTHPTTAIQPSQFGLAAVGVNFDGVSEIEFNAYDTFLCFLFFFTNVA